MSRKSVKFKPKLVNYSRTSYTVFSRGIFKSIFLILLVVMVVGMLMNGDSYNNALTLRGFLTVLAEAPAIPTDWISFGSSIPDDVTSLPVIGTLVDFFASAAEVLMFFVVGIGQAIIYILYFLKILFNA